MSRVIHPVREGLPSRCDRYNAILHDSQLLLEVQYQGFLLLVVLGLILVYDLHQLDELLYLVVHEVIKLVAELVELLTVRCALLVKPDLQTLDLVMACLVIFQGKGSEGCEVLGDVVQHAVGIVEQCCMPCSRIGQASSHCADNTSAAAALAADARGAC
eukprot:CAMPEP_0168424896 /NCGR_PEP_ID=MMETSP0228-20121227/35051_1 /TAXON_ID=133427 /ORGANISM="Protoceratium reticulatum, Strain CCCM 535 (=CCMP 1889)" /LENGTH=158 /DNA_ID=CAMNT_0008438885 /DNA_START=181 /DNA_END=654 /DNA_ORIENTATION=-